jgi:hypothetical protein
MEEQERSIIRPGADPLVLTTMRRRKFEMYPLLKQEVDQLKAGYTSPAMALFGIFLGSGLAFALTRASTTLPPLLDARFLDFAYLSFGLALICAVRAGIEWWKATQIVANIEKETVEVSIVQEPTKLQ